MLLNIEKRREWVKVSIRAKETLSLNGQLYNKTLIVCITTYWIEI